MVQKMLLAAVLVALCAPAVAQDSKDQPKSSEKPAVQEGVKAGEAQSSFVKEEFPFDGEITADRLNVRLFPKADAAQSIIAAVLGQGSKVTALAAKDDWYQIVPPQGVHVWIWARNVKKDNGSIGTVIGSDVPVRLDSRANADKVAALNEGTPVTIISENMGWYKIVPPDSVKYFVAKKHVKYVGKAEVKASDKPTTPQVAPGTDWASLLKEAEMIKEEQNALLNERKLDELDFAKVAIAFEAAAAAVKDPVVKRQAESDARHFRQMQNHWDIVKLQKDIAEKQLTDLRAQIDEKGKPITPKWAFTGYVDTVGRIWNRPGTHKLLMGGKIICYMKVKDGNEDMLRRINDNFERYVGLTGTVEKCTEGFDGYSVITVESIEKLEK